MDELEEFLSLAQPGEGVDPEDAKDEEVRKGVIEMAPDDRPFNEWCDDVADVSEIMGDLRWADVVRRMKR
jgi:hypothetical protein